MSLFCCLARNAKRRPGMISQARLTERLGASWGMSLESQDSLHVDKSQSLLSSCSEMLILIRIRLWFYFMMYVRLPFYSEEPIYWRPHGEGNAYKSHRGHFSEKRKRHVGVLGLGASVDCRGIARPRWRKAPLRHVSQQAHGEVALSGRGARHYRGGVPAERFFVRRNTQARAVS